MDAYVYPKSNDWMPNMKERSLGHTGDGSIPTKKRIMVRIRPFEGIVDMAEHRRQLRTKLINQKATLVEGKMNDIISFNDAERKFKKQQEELRRLQNAFSQSVLSNVFVGIKSKLDEDIYSDLLNNDPDIQSFDASTNTIMKQAEQLAEIQQRNDALEIDLRDTKQELRTEITALISEARDAEDLEYVANTASMFEKIEEEFKEAPVAIATQTGDIDEDVMEANIEAEEAREEQLEAQDEIAEETLQRVRARRPRIPDPTKVQESLNEIISAKALISLARSDNIKLTPRLERQVQTIESGAYEEAQRRVPRPKNVKKLVSKLESEVFGAQRRIDSYFQRISSPGVEKK